MERLSSFLLFFPSHQISLGKSPLMRREETQHQRNQLQVSRCLARANDQKGTLTERSSLHALEAE